MIKLSDVKVRAQYRTRVRYRLVVLEGAGARGVAAAAIELIRHARHELGYGAACADSGCNACTGSGWRWGPSNGCSGPWDCPDCGGPASGSHAR